ncbi:MAG: Sensor protein ZraS [Candidatus Accumulibacter appositus]|uniref:histidine kinase n=1 Tax=Candidatus Accumulibacter appositus TaxID=1454003 RepID=A0A011N4W4_9PROT|nr:hemerythrin domain-containing protein [Accumulibacter sp.]EXI77598.1 MAG: Sensor protein ZraS [Candidatus Accumulibacter appositus]HRF03946.1 hemerythrin domain-containing protein [Accumulibacter sp.]
MTFKWNRHFETGIAIVDSQHQGLVGLINEAAPLLTGGGPVARARLEALLSRLGDYANAHFTTEEGVMRSCGLLADYIAKQHADHRAFVEQLGAFRAQMDDESVAAVGPSLLRYLTSWLTFHILDEDQRMARQMRLVEAGQSPESAFAESGVVARDDHARATLIAALMDLHAVLGERNKTLHATNEKLKESSQQLAQLNQELETRVAARTDELQTSVQHLERAKGQLLQSEKMAAVGQLAAGVAHEINNPISFVNSNIGSLRGHVRQLLELIAAFDELRDTIPANDLRRQRIEAACAKADLDYLRQDIGELIDESAQGLTRVKKIVEDLKNFSRVDEAEWQLADLNDGIESTINVAGSELKYKAEVVRNYGQLPLVRCVPAQLNQVFLNLLVNAAQSIDVQGTITVSTGSDDDIVWIEIVDTGKGMGEAVQRRIFEPFYTTKAVGQGTGLGLSISWQIIVEKHRGNIDVRSEPGRGTRFRIELPRSTTPESSDNGKAHHSCP